jgi:predicted peroxiredoxin
MAGYVFIESRDPFGSNEGSFVTETATGLKAKGHDVTVYLVQNGVLGARGGARSPYLPTLTEAGIEVLADNFSLEERGMAASTLPGGVRGCEIGELVDLLADANTKAVWH